MAVFGWIALSILAVFGVGMLVLFAIPFVVSEVKTLSYKIKTFITDKKFDVDQKSEARRKRDEIRRLKQNELADKKLEVKLQKVNKQIDIYKKKLALSEELKQSVVAEKRKQVVEQETQATPISKKKVVRDDSIIDFEKEIEKEVASTEE